MARCRAVWHHTLERWASRLASPPRGWCRQCTSALLGCRYDAALCVAEAEHPSCFHERALGVQHRAHLRAYDSEESVGRLGLDAEGSRAGLGGAIPGLHAGGLSSVLFYLF